jgi:hydroxyacylglutathione hydrolase
MKRINRDGPPPVGTRRAPRQLPAEALAQALRDGFVIDARTPERFAGGHVPNTMNVPFGGSFSTWAASMLPYDRPVYIVAEERSDAALARAARDLTLVGVDGLAGWFDARALDVWAARHGALEKITLTTVDEVARRLSRGDVAVVDVRGRAEWEAGHLPGVPNVPLATLAHELDRVRALAGDRPLVVHCQGGTRSAVAASLLRAHGVSNVANLVGGFRAWEQAGLPVDGGTEAALA